jgi:ABC-type bacteriocin/lantibiotic exporter with double-glycine peptidase domain
MIKNQGQSIDINKIFYDSVMNNKSIIYTLVPIFIGYYLQDSVFTRSIASISADIPNFVSTISLKNIGILILPYVIALVLFYISNVVIAQTLPRIEMEVIHRLTTELIESIKTSKNQINTNDLMMHIKKIADAKNTYKIFISYFAPTIVIALTLVYMFLQNDTMTGLLVLILIIALFTLTANFESKSVMDAYKTEESSNHLFDQIHDVVVNMDNVITSDTKDQELMNIKQVQDSTYGTYYDGQITNVNVTYGLQGISIITMLGINYLAYNLYVDNRINSEMFVSTVLLSLLFMDYYNNCINAIMELITGVGRFYESSVFFSDFKVMVNDPKLQKIFNTNTVNRKMINKNIIFDQVNVRYGKQNVCGPVDLVIKGHGPNDNKITGIVGSIGSGKTSLMKALANIVEYDGDIYVDGQKLKTCTNESLAKEIGYIPQHPKLFNKTVMYNIGYGTNLSDKEITEKIESMGLSPFIKSLSNGFNTLAGKEGNNLSGGQRQFVSLIRSILQNKTIILMDEPTSSLDQINKKLFIRLIKNLKNVHLIITSHDTQLTDIFDTVIRIDKGQVVNIVEK